MDFTPTKIPEVILILPKIYKDDRGDFHECYRQAEFEAAGITPNFVQDNHAGSKRDVLRGLHYQINQAQGKLIRVIKGEIYDVAVDLRKSSITFGQSVGVMLDDKAKNQLWIPPGFAHGYYVLSDWAEVSYKVTAYYAPEWERTLLWNDPALGIDWPLLTKNTPLLSKNDKQGLLLKDAEVYD
jgi:dTDP-4-dehydrorhamnose 3,5-epimerase